MILISFRKFHTAVKYLSLMFISQSSIRILDFQLLQYLIQLFSTSLFEVFNNQNNLRTPVFPSLKIRAICELFLLLFVTENDLIKRKKKSKL